MPITRTTVMLRAKYGWPLNTVPFSKTDFHQPDGYRQDAAGFLSMCWDIPLNAKHSWGGLSTVSLESDGWAKEIDPIDLKSGDAIGYLGPNSVDGDGGVIVIFEGWLNGDHRTMYAMTYQQLPQYSPGPTYIARPYDMRWHCYRFRDIVDE